MSKNQLRDLIYKQFPKTSRRTKWNVVLDYMKKRNVQVICTDGMLDDSDYFYIQPCDTNDAEKNKVILLKSIEFCKENPKWSLSLQTHKIIGVR